MKVKMALSTTNTSAIIRNLYAKDADAVRAIRQVTVANAELIKFLTEQMCPRDTNFMADNVEIWYGRDQMTSEVGWDETNFIQNSPTRRFYPIFVEFGTSRTRAQPSLFPAMEQARPLFEQNLRDALRAAIRRRRGLA